MSEMELYKLTTQELTTRNDTTWALGEWKEEPLGEMCGPGGFHAYTSPLLAILLNPIHANILNPRLFRCEWRGEMLNNDHGLKVKVEGLRLVEELPLPVITTEQRVRFGILASLEITRSPKFRAWAEAWLSGEDRSAAAEARAAWAAKAARAAAWAAARSATLDLIALAERACLTEKGEQDATN